jgi:hypothetical protein
LAEVTVSRGEYFVAKEPLIMFYVSRALGGDRPDPYEAVRRAWRINVDKAREYNLILARDHDKIIGAYRPTEWRKYQDGRGRWAFVGKPAESEVWNLYVGKRVHPNYLTGRSPFRYCEPEDAIRW